MSLREKILTVLFGIIFLVSAVIRFEQTKNGQFPFTYDQARDMLDIRALGEFKDLMVMGPTTSINGLRLGPFYYYLMLPAYWMGRGNPQALVNWNIVLFLMSAVAIFVFFRKRNIALGTLISAIYLMAPRMFETTKYFWNAHSATIISVYFYLALWNFVEKKDKKAIFWLGLTASLLLQFEAAFGIVCLLFAGLVIIINKKIKYGKEFLAGVIPWFLPQILVEIKNRFQMSKLLWGMFSGTNQVLGDKLSWGESASSHLASFGKMLEGQLVVPMYFGLGIAILAFIGLFLFKKYREVNKYFWMFWIFAWIFYVVAYHHPIKEWYLESLRVWFCLVTGIAIYNLMNYKKILAIILGLFLLRSFVMTGEDQWRLSQIKLNDDPKNMANLQKNIDWIYKRMEANGFEAYSYVPEIYDYPQQYLYWWYGRLKYGYMPGKISYSLTQVPEYIREQDKYYEQTRENNKKIALIYEIKRDYQAWLGQFKNYCIQEEWGTEWQTKVEIRNRCQEK